MMNKEQFRKERTRIMSEMLDNPDEHGIYPTTKCFEQLDNLFDQNTIYDVVKKLIGPIAPIGESHGDDIRYENLLEMEDLLDRLMSDVFEVTNNKNNHQFSRSKAGKKAVQILNALKDYTS